jgi:two-component system response regulator
MDDLMNIKKVLNILLVEDNYGDILLTKQAFKKIESAVNIEVARDGEIAMDRLHKRGEFAGSKLPDLIFLDWNIPKKDGKELLAEIKEDEMLRRIPVVIMTSSSAERDIIDAYSLNANSYIIKPMDLKQFVDVAKSIESFWFDLAVMPPPAVKGV